MPDTTQQSTNLTVEQALQMAVTHHQAGQLPQAEQLYRAILQAEPRQPDANHNLGVLLVQLKQPAVALPHFEAALGANAKQPQYWLSYLDALIQANMPDAARQVLPLARQHGVPEDALKQLAGLLENKQQPQQMEPGRSDIDALTSLFNTRQYAEAAKHAHAMTQRFPSHGLAWKMLGAALRQLGMNAEALTAMQKAAELLPDDADVHNILGMILRALGRLDEAENCYRNVLSINPEFAVAHSNLGNTLREAGRLEEAEARLRKALSIRPDMAETHYNLGSTLQRLGRMNDAEASFRQAVKFKPDFAGAHYSLGVLLLASGRYAEGWREYEHRWEGAIPKPPALATRLPQWLGQRASPNDRLLVFEEQGLGDKLQFSRYLPMVAKCFPAGVSLVVCEPLRTLFRRSFPKIDILDAAPADESAWNWQLPLLSLPLAFGTTLETIPCEIPYLHPDPVRVDYWKEKLAALNLPDATRKIGVVWKTGSKMADTAERSLSLHQLVPLLNQPHGAWFSLQKEPDAGTAQWLSSGKLIDWTTELTNFNETAALAQNLDLIISIDTSVAHLAGALGKPVWLFNRRSSEWRWMHDREDSPWYPSMRIFTQQTAGAWDEVVSRMAAKLKESAL